MKKRTIAAACAGMAFCLAAGTANAAANFEGDVNTAINRGLDYLNADGAFTGYPGCGGSYVEPYVRGLALLALLEKRASGSFSDPPQGYAGASAEDKARMRKAVSCILADVNDTSYESYYYGNWLMGLALYARTGGPGKGAADIPDNADLIDLPGGIAKLADGVLNAQGTSGSTAGMWGYSGPGDDSSTTQFAAAGLAGAKGYYVWAGDSGGRLSRINAALALAGNAYATRSRTGSDNGSCYRIQESESGFGYHTSYNPSMQQTASGLWVQLLGGATVNDPSVQAYLKWIRNHYRWADLDSMGNSWPGASYWYFMWSTMKGLLTIEESNITPSAGNLGASSYGLLAPTDDPDTSDSLAGTCNVRQLHKDPATVVRPAAFGADGAGYYSGETPSTYFDFASEILSHQCGDGSFGCNGAPSSWGPSYYGTEWDRSAWALLVLQRATGGACVDANEDGKCDGSDQEGPVVYGTCDVDGNGKVTTADVFAMLPFAKSRIRIGGGNAVPPGADAANAVHFEPSKNEGGWFESRGDDEVNIADFTRCIFKSQGH